MVTTRDTFQALLIGVGQYKHITDMPSMIYDVQALSEVLTDARYCYFQADNIATLTGKAAHKHAIMSGLARLVQKSTISSTVLIYFAGHGIQTDQGKVFLCPYETDLQALEETTIAGDEFSRYLSAIPARKKVVLLDACHSSGAAIPRAPDSKNALRNPLPDAYIDSLAQGSGTIVISSSRDSQQSWDRKDGRHGVFTWHLLEGLKGAADQEGGSFIRIFNLFEYIQQHVQQEVLHSYGQRQEPIMHAKDIDSNFPLAVRHAPQQQNNTVNNLREMIIKNPLQGAKVLSDYLSQDAQWEEMRNEVDLHRANLQKIDKESRLFGADPGNSANQSRIIFSLLNIVQQIEV